jgi:hypothetical protein
VSKQLDTSQQHEAPTTVLPAPCLKTNQMSITDSQLASRRPETVRTFQHAEGSWATSIHLTGTQHALTKMHVTTQLNLDIKFLVASAIWLWHIPWHDMILKQAIASIMAQDIDADVTQPRPIPTAPSTSVHENLSSCAMGQTVLFMASLLQFRAPSTAVHLWMHS